MDPPSKPSRECDRTLESLSPEEYRRIEERCHDLKFSTGTMLKKNQTLKDVIEADLVYLKSANITCQQIIDRIDYILEVEPDRLIKPKAKPRFFCERGWCSRGIIAEVKKIGDRIFEIHHLSFGGAQECPFHQESAIKDKYMGYEYGSSDFVIIDVATKAELYFGSLLLHMIEKHNFFEGPGVNYRVDPRTVVNFLRLEPGVNYRPSRIEVQYWSDVASTSEFICRNEPLARLIEKEATEVIDDVHFYLLTEAHHQKYKRDQRKWLEKIEDQQIQPQGSLLIVVIYPLFKDNRNARENSKKREERYAKMDKLQERLNKLPRFILIDNVVFDLSKLGHYSFISEYVVEKHSYLADSSIVKIYQGSKIR